MNGTRATMKVAPTDGVFTLEALLPPLRDDVMKVMQRLFMIVGRRMCCEVEVVHDSR